MTFPEEIAVLSDTQGSPEARHPRVSKGSPIYKSWPFLDEHGVLRLRGRIGATAFASAEAKYPAILPRQHRITFLLVDWYHRRFRHANRETVTNEVRQCFEISKPRVLVERVRKCCMMCRVRNALPSPPAMAPLPAARLRRGGLFRAGVGQDWKKPDEKMDSFVHLSYHSRGSPRGGAQFIHRVLHHSCATFCSATRISG